MTFDLFPWRFEFRAREPLYFPPGKAANILRGALGVSFRELSCPPTCRDPSRCPYNRRCDYGLIFTPASGGVGPSGLADLPRPFVFRAAHLDDRNIAEGETFHFDIHLFITRNPPITTFIFAFEHIVRQGLGPWRGKAKFESVSQLNADHLPLACLYSAGLLQEPATLLRLPLTASGPDCNRLRVQFLTPTELKACSAIVTEPGFHVLFGRARDRVATLRSRYGDGPLDIDFRSMADRARKVRIARCDLTHVAAERRSSRTGQTHPIGGFVGEVEYEGELAEFIPFLRAAEWTGIGRQTVWGKGEIRLHTS